MPTHSQFLGGMPNNLLRTGGGFELSADICLKVAEHVLDYDPKAVLVMLTLSKSFKGLLETYQKSITKTLSNNWTRHQTLNIYHSNLSPSCCPWPDNNLVSSYTYRWLSEIDSRNTIINTLVSHNITELVQPMARWAQIQLGCRHTPLEELKRRNTLLKTRGFQLLYCFVDSTTGLTSEKDIRAMRTEFLESSTTLELAILGVLVRILGLAHYGQTNEQKMLRWESTCVMEDKLLRYGPFFIWASLGESRRSKDWFEAEMEKGVAALNAFESGDTEIPASLQSLVWKEIGKRTGGVLYDQWNVARDVILREMEKLETCKIKV